MEEIGARELKATLSAVLRRVRSGEVVRVTVRGRPVADIVPPRADGSADAVRSLIAAGRISAPEQARSARPPRLARGERLASALVLADRNAEH